MVKRILVLIFFFAFFEGNSFAKLSSKVDERFELTSIVFRLANAEEYMNDEVKDYIDDIDNYFIAYRNHPLIKYTKEIREKDEIAYNAVSGSTALLIIEKGNVRLNPQADIAKYISIDYRWKEETLEEYVKLLNDFYKKTRFRYFFEKHVGLYTQTEIRFNELLNLVDNEWFGFFYGIDFGSPKIYVSLCNGRNNYAISTSYLKNAPNEYSIILGSSMIDEKGIPTFDENIVIPIIIHEFCHKFTNPLINTYKNQMIDEARKIYPYVKEQLRAVGYGSAKTILEEGFNNLFVQMYFKEHPTGFEKYNIAENERYGFVWMKRAVSFMDNFYLNRELYPTINEFMPQLVDFFNFMANDIEEIIKEYVIKNPRVINTFPAALNGKIDANIKEIRIEFSFPMWNSLGISLMSDTTITCPVNYDFSWSEDKRIIIFPVSLNKNTKYGFILPKGVYQSEDTYPMLEDFEIKFETTK